MSEPIHADDELLAALIDGSLDSDRALTVRIHLSGCEDCRRSAELLEEVLAGARSGVMSGGPTALGPAEARVAAALELAGRLETEDAAAEASASLLLRTDSSSPTGLRRDPEVFSAGAVRWLLAEASRLCESDPARAHSLATAAAGIADRLSPATYPPHLIAQWTGEARLERANALRASGDYTGALAALDEADARFEASATAALQRASVGYVRAVVLTALERPEEALPVALRARATFAEHGETLREINAGMAAALSLSRQGRSGEARTTLEELETLARSVGSEPAVALVTRNLALFLVDVGEVDEALLRLSRVTETLPESKDAVSWAYARFALARSLVSCGRPSEGVELLREVGERFSALGKAGEAAGVALELVDALLQVPDAAEACRVAANLPRVFASAGLGRRAAMAAAYLREAATAERLTRRDLGSVRGYLERLHTDPEAEFAPPAA